MKSNRTCGNDILNGISERHPQLAQYLQRLKRPRSVSWASYETAKRHVEQYSLTSREYEACIRFIADRLRM
jgi:hypothetical protein